MKAEQYEVNWKNYYDILELRPTARAREIKSAYRYLARKHHPDRAENPPAPNRMAEINEAYEVLSNTDRRLKYDETFTFMYSRQCTAEETADTGLTEAVITRLNRERHKNRWARSPLVSIPAIMLERLLNPIPGQILLLSWLIYLLICLSILMSILH
jgi:hypothetical protein